MNFRGIVNLKTDTCILRAVSLCTRARVYTHCLFPGFFEKGYSTGLIISLTSVIVTSFVFVGFVMAGDTRSQTLNTSPRNEQLQASEAAGTENHDGQFLMAAKKHEKDPLIRRRLNRAIAVSAAEGMLGDLVASLQTDEAALVRQGAAQILGNYVGSPIVLHALMDALDKEIDPAVRYACALSLTLSTEKSAFRVMEALTHDNDPNIRRQIAYGLTRNRSPQAKALLRNLERDRDPGVRRMARGDR
jgi:HEAT repeat protein